jgi:tetratricopeptide (TPR) repeat protein
MAEEYFALGDAYYKLKKYEEAENWLNKSKFHKSTKIASEYILGCIAYETGRYKEASSYFELIIRLDEENIIALKAAAYTCIKLKELDRAALYYQKILDLVPEASDEGYNYSLVLLALGRAEEAENVLLKYCNTESAEAQLVLARSMKQRGNAQAADAYAASLLKKDDPVVRAEFAAYLAESGYIEKALEEYKKALESAALSAEKKEEIEKTMEALKADVKSSPKT